MILINGNRYINPEQVVMFIVDGLVVEFYMSGGQSFTLTLDSDKEANDLIERLVEW